METPTELSLYFIPQEGVSVDWSELPSDLLQMISKNLHDLFDFSYFRTVCKNWRMATSVFDLPHQIPWLLEERENSDDKVLRFYSLFSGKTRKIRYPQSCGMHLYGPTYGFLYATNIGLCDQRCVLLNPITKDEVFVYLEKYSQSDFLGMGPDPIGSNDQIVFLIDWASQTLGFCQPRDWEWDYVKVPDFMLETGGVCLKGRYYMNENATGNTWVVDISCGTWFSVPAPPENLENSLVYVSFVESAGKILRVVKKLDLGLDESNSNCSFDIYQLDGRNHEYRWVKTSTIGNQILFLDWRAGISVSETTGLKGNCIYYIQNRLKGFLVFSRDVYKYNIEDGQTEKISTPFNKGATWLVPSLVPLAGYS